MKKQQLKFWCYVKKYLEDFSDAALSRFIRIEIESRISCLNYYQQLENEYGDPKSCENILISNYSLKWKQLFELNAENDRDSRLGTHGGGGVYPQILGATHFLDFIWSN